MNQISMKKGMWAYFDFQNHQIAVHISPMSGKETVYLDDHPVSEKRNLLSFIGEHSVEIEGQALTIQILLENPFTYKTEVRIKKGARTLQSQSAHLFAVNKESFMYLLSLLTSFILVGGLAGYLLAKLLVE